MHFLISAFFIIIFWWVFKFSRRERKFNISSPRVGIQRVMRSQPRWQISVEQTLDSRLSCMSRLTQLKYNPIHSGEAHCIQYNNKIWNGKGKPDENILPSWEKKKYEWKHLTPWYSLTADFLAYATTKAVNNYNKAPVFSSYPISKGHLFVTWGEMGIVDMSFFHGFQDFYSYQMNSEARCTTAASRDGPKQAETLK